MFSAKNLIGSAQRLGGTRVEFTPIGKAQQRNRPVEPENIGDSSFLNSFEATADDFLDDTITGMPDMVSRTSRSASRSLNPVTNIAGARTSSKFGNEIVSKGVSSVREQQLENKKLEAENYNLKVKLATLSRFFDQTPADQRRLLEENVDLKIQLSEAGKELKRLHDRLEEVEFLNEKENHTKERDEAEERARFKEGELQKLRNETRAYIEELEGKVGQLQQEIERGNENQLANQQLLREAEVRAERAEQVAMEKDDFIQQMRQEMTQLELQRDQILQNLKLQGHELESAHSQTLSSLEKQLRTALEEKELLETSSKEDKRQLRQLKDNLDATTSTIARLEDDVSRWQAKVTALRQENSNEDNRTIAQLMASEQENSKLKDKIDELERSARKYEMDYSDLNRKLSGTVAADDVARLQRSKDDLQDEVDIKTQQISQLRMQIAQMQSDSLQKSVPSIDRGEVLRLQTKVADLQDELQQRDNIETSLRNRLVEAASLNGNNAAAAAELKFFQDQYEEAKIGERKWRSEYDVLQLQHEIDISSLHKEISGLKDQLDFYENEFATSEQQSKREINRLKEACSQLEQDLEGKQRQLHLYETQQSYNTPAKPFSLNTTEVPYNSGSINSLHLMESIRFLEKENGNLRQNLAEAKLNIQNLQRLLDEERMLNIPGGFDTGLATPPYRSNEFETTRLKSQVKDKDIRIHELESRAARLEGTIRENEITIESLEMKVKEFNKAKRLNAMNEEEEMSDFLQLKSATSAKIRALNFEINRLKEEHEREMEMIKRSKDNSTNNAFVKLLEKQLEDVKLEKEELQAKIKKEGLNKDELKSRLDVIKDEKDTNADLVTRLQRAKEKLGNEVSELEVENKKFRKDNEIAQEEIEDFKLELKRSHKDCTILSSKIKEFNDKATRDKAELKELQHQIKMLSFDEKKSKTSLKEALYYKARLYDEKLKIVDLHLINDYAFHVIKNFNNKFKDNIAQISRSGVYPDYSTTSNQGRKKLTFKILAKFVLALVRMKNRAEYTKNRNNWLEDLKTDIKFGIH